MFPFLFPGVVNSLPSLCCCHHYHVTPCCSSSSILRHSTIYYLPGRFFLTFPVIFFLGFHTSSLLIEFSKTQETFGLWYTAISMIDESSLFVKVHLFFKLCCYIFELWVCGNIGLFILDQPGYCSVTELIQCIEKERNEREGLVWKMKIIWFQLNVLDTYPLNELWMDWIFSYYFLRDLK